MEVDLVPLACEDRLFFMLLLLFADFFQNYVSKRFLHQISSVKLFDKSRCLQGKLIENEEKRGYQLFAC